MKVLILGADGLVGRSLRAKFRGSNHQVFTRTKLDTNITRTEDVLDVIRRLRPDVVFNCAAKTNVDWCERHPERAFDVNTRAPSELYGALLNDPKLSPRWFVCFSSEMVFGHELVSPEEHGEEDELRPINAYGFTKAAMEVLLRELRRARENVHVDYTVIRTSWVYSVLDELRSNDDFPRKMLDLMYRQKELVVPNDVVGRPTLTGTLAGYAAKLLYDIQLGKDLDVHRGVINVADAGTTSRFNCARYIHKCALARGLPITCREVLPTTEAEFRRRFGGARRPLNGKLARDKFERLGLAPNVNWRLATRYILSMPTLRRGVVKDRDDTRGSTTRARARSATT